MIELINKAVQKGAQIFSSVSGGKDGQAMTAALIKNGFNIAGLIHADLGSVEWKESLPMCENLSVLYNIPLFIVKRSDGLGMLEYWKRRMEILKGKNKPFWSSAKNRYCTSDLKRSPINKFFTTQSDFIISCEGIRASESKARSLKTPLTIREGKTSSYYKGMTVEEAIENYKPGKRLTLTWYPIFNYSEEDVWGTFGMSGNMLLKARNEYKQTKIVPQWWKFHPAYVYGNDRVSCMFCVLGCNNDLSVAAEHNPTLLNEIIKMEEESGFTFKNNWSLKSLIK